MTTFHAVCYFCLQAANNFDEDVLLKWSCCRLKGKPGVD
jgi:hypothetical protein